MRCGNCHKDHDTVAEVRNCYSLPAQPQAEPAWRSHPLTERQYNKLQKIMGEGELPPYAEAKQKITKGMASEVIGLAERVQGYGNFDGWRDYGSMAGSHTEDELALAAEAHLFVDQKPVAPVQVKNTAERYAAIPAGHYAVPSLTGNNDLDFFCVDKPTEGRWTGYIFVKRVIGGRPDVAVKTGCKMQALEAILKAGPAEAAQKYGQEIGRCFKCNRHLTDETSRQLGIGPDCRSKSA